jgi:tryptophan-rich sensory protein
MDFFSFNNPIIHILIPIILALAMNLIIYAFGINKQDDKRVKNEYFKLFPPGYIIGIIWTIILGLLGYAHYLIYKLNNKYNFSCLAIVFVIIFCLSYSIITSLKFKNGLLYNLITLIVSFILGIIVILESKYIFLYIIPLIVWASYVNIVDTLICSNNL